MTVADKLDKAPPANMNLVPGQMNLVYNATSIPSALMFAASNEQDFLRRVFGTSRFGAALDRELGDLMTTAHPLPTGRIPGPVSQKLFTYVRYNVELTRTGLDVLGLTNIMPEHVQQMDSVDHITELRAVGAAVGKNVKKAHFESLLSAAVSPFSRPQGVGDHTMAMELPDFVSEFADRQEPGVDLIDSGPGTKRLYQVIGNEGKTRSILATNFWRAWLASDLAGPFLAALGASPGVFSRSRTVIVWRPDVGRFDLVVLDPALALEFSPKAMSISLPGVMTPLIMSGAVRAFADDPIPLLGMEAPQLAAEVSGDGKYPFAVVLAREPAFERLSVPSSPLAVDNLLGSSSTAGVLVEDSTQAGRLGVTAALHGVDPATKVTVGTQSGTVVRTDSVTDSAFIELSSPYVSAKSVKGVLSGLAPRGNQSAEFVGVISKTCPTVITGWDSQIPSPSSRRQACVYTRRDAQPGDSGSALVTDDDWIAGFAFERSKPNESPAQCSWIWADSVLNRLKLKLK